MPLRPARVGRVGVIGAPVAKTAVVAAAVTPRGSRAARGCVTRGPAVRAVHPQLPGCGEVLELPSQAKHQPRPR